MGKTKIYNLTKLVLFICTIFSVLMIGTLAAAAEDKQISLEEQIQPEPFQMQQIKNQGNRLVMGENIESKEKVNGDAIALVGNVSLDDGASGDAVAIIGNIKGAGNFNGNVVAIGGNVTLSGAVNGDVVAIGGKIILKDGTVVNGDVVGSSIDKGEGVTVGGEYVQLPIPNLNLAGNTSGIKNFDFSHLEPLFFGLKVGAAILSYLILLGVLAIYPQGVAKIEEAVQRDTLRVLVIGFITFLLLFPIFITIVGIPIGLVLILAGKFLGYAGVLMVIGKKFLETIRFKVQAPYLQLLTGLILMFFIGYIPFVGMFVGMFAFWIALGAVIDTKFGTGKPWFNSRVHI